MTCLEKYLQDNPTFSADEVIGTLCPNVSGGIDIPDPEYCIPRTGEGCVKCWNREIPGTESDEPHIRDSGSRTEFSTGAVRDIQKGKGRCDLMPLDVVANIAGEYDGNPDPIIASIGHFQTSGDTTHLYHALERFAGKAFTRDNLGTSCCNMCLEVSKHFEEGAEKYGEGNWQKGLPAKCYINSGVRHYLKYLRGDKDENHHLAFCWNLMCAIWTCKHRPELNDYAHGKLGFDPDDFMGEYEEEND
jgi:hypothetical protein